MRARRGKEGRRKSHAQGRSRFAPCSRVRPPFFPSVHSPLDTLLFRPSLQRPRRTVHIQPFKYGDFWYVPFHRVFVVFYSLLACTHLQLRADSDNGGSLGGIWAERVVRRPLGNAEWCYWRAQDGGRFRFAACSRVRPSSFSVVPTR